MNRITKLLMACFLFSAAVGFGWARFLCKKTQRRRDIDIDDLPLVRAPKKLPVGSQPGGSRTLVDASPNRCHRTLLMLVYATGSRRAEAVMNGAGGRVR